MYTTWLLVWRRMHLSSQENYAIDLIFVHRHSCNVQWIAMHNVWFATYDHNSAKNWKKVDWRPLRPDSAVKSIIEIAAKYSTWKIFSWGFDKNVKRALCGRLSIIKYIIIMKLISHRSIFCWLLDWINYRPLLRIWFYKRKVWKKTLSGNVNESWLCENSFRSLPNG